MFSNNVKTNNKVCLIGTGNIGAIHARVLYELKSLRAIVDPDKTKIEIANKYKCEFYSNLDIFISDVRLGKFDIDSFVIATPTNLHYATILKVIDLSKNILVEKPLCKDSFESRIILQKLNGNNFSIPPSPLDLSDVRNNYFTVGHIERFNPVVQGLKSNLVKVGKIKSVNITRVGPSPSSLHVLKNGVCIDLLVHDVDLIRYLTSDDFQFSISRKDISFDTNVDYGIDCMVRMKKDGILAHLKCNWATKFKKRQIQIIGEDGELFGDLIHKNAFYQDSSDLKIHDILIDDVEPMKLQHQAFLEKDDSIAISPREALEVIEIVESIKESNFVFH